MSKPIVLITSAAGRIGRELIARLAQNGKFTIRACYYSEGKATYLQSLGADEVVKFDLNDPTTWQAALESVTPFIPHHLIRYWRGIWHLAKHSASIKIISPMWFGLAVWVPIQILPHTTPTSIRHALGHRFR